MSAAFAGLSRRVRLRLPSSENRRPQFDARNPADTEPVSGDTDIFVSQRDGGKCRNCGSIQHLPFDHVIPHSWGGASTADNIQLLCRDCNLKKGASLLDGGDNHCGGLATARE